MHHIPDYKYIINGDVGKSSICIFFGEKILINSKICKQKMKDVSFTITQNRP